MFHFRQRYALEIGETVVNGLRADLFAKTQRQPMSFFHRVKLGRIIGRVTSDVEALRVGIQDVLFVSAIQSGQMLFSAVVMAWSDWVLFLVVLGLAPVLWVLNRHFRVKLSHSFARGERQLQSRDGDARRIGQWHSRDAGFCAPANQCRTLPPSARGPLALQYRAGSHLGDPHAAARTEQPVLRRDPADVWRLARFPRLHGRRCAHHVFPARESIFLADRR